MIFCCSRFSGTKTTDLMPARAAAAATALARLPVDGQASTCRPSSRAADSATATTRSLNEWVGLPESSFTHSCFRPRSSARWRASTSRVKPGSVERKVAMSAGTGSKGAYRQIDFGPASISARVIVGNSYPTSSGPKHSRHA